MVPNIKEQNAVYRKEVWRAKEMHRELLKVRHCYEKGLPWLRTEQSLANLWREKL